MQEYIKQIEQGFQTLKVGEQYKKVAFDNLSLWLKDPQFAAYRDQIVFMVEAKKFDLLLDAFYQVIPFGTGGRRGPVGIGPNRINPWTIQASAQGHSNYLLSLFGEDAKKRGIVICYDVRKYPKTTIYSPDKHNPVQDISSKDFALCAASVYSANGIKCYVFDGVRSTPELSFAVRHLHTVAGVVISASHNPKEDNGKKVYGEDGGQLLPPEDQRLSDVVNGVKEIKTISIPEARANGLLDETFTSQTDEAYVKEVTSLSLIGNKVDKNSLTIAFSPLHGVGFTSVYETLKRQNFKIVFDDRTSTPDGSFPNVKFNIPNPEVVESMETLIERGKSVDADILVSSDPDADRLGLMARTSGKGKDSLYRYFNGNEIGIILTHFALDEMKKQGKLPQNGVMTKTTVTSELIAKISRSYGVEVVGELLVGFKYIANEIKQLEKKNERNRFILGMEESHGFLVGTYCRDKDAAGAALLLSELAAQLKAQGKNIAVYLDEIYTKFGYDANKQASLIFLGAEGKEKIDKITASLRSQPPEKIGSFKVNKFMDRWKGTPILSPTDESSRNVLSFFLEAPKDVDFIKITVRPSGTEPKIKIYAEVGGNPLPNINALTKEKERLHGLLQEAICNFTKMAYSAVGINMPDHGFKLSNLLPVETKLKYFDVEKELLELEKKVASSSIANADVKKRVDELFAVFGKDPIEKISDAFQEKTGLPLRKFLAEKLKLSM